MVIFDPENGSVSILLPPTPHVVRTLRNVVPGGGWSVASQLDVDGDGKDELVLARSVDASDDSAQEGVRGGARFHSEQ